MPDLLVPLYALPNLLPAGPVYLEPEVTIRVAMPYETSQVLNWIAEEFSPGWRDEASIAFSRNPIACLIATRQGQLLGFACYDATARGFFGPLGVSSSARAGGIGTHLTLKALSIMRELGYAYAIIGGVGPTEFYRKIAPIFEIPHSSPGIYGDRLNTNPALPAEGVE